MTKTPRQFAYDILDPACEHADPAYTQPANECIECVEDVVRKAMAFAWKEGYNAPKGGNNPYEDKEGSDAGSR